MNKEVEQAQDLTKSFTNLALSISQDYSRVVQNKESDISECVYKCSEFSKQVLELQERTEIATDTVETFRIGLRTIFDRTEKLECQVEVLQKRRSSKTRT